MNDFRVLTVQSFGETSAEDARITLSPSMIQMVAALDDTRQGRPVKRATVLFADGGSVDLYLSEFDLLTVEKVVGSYCLGDF